MFRSRLPLALSCAALLCARCAEDEPEPSPIDPTFITAFSDYCTATLMKGRAATKSVGTNEWRGGIEVPEGTGFLLGDDFDDTVGYVLLDDDTIARLDATDLADAASYSTTCADHGTETVTLTTATLYSTSARNGTPCRMERGTVITSYAIVRLPAYAQVETPEVETLCGFSPGYTNDFIHGDLRLK